jgi:hypothetical protein
MDPSNAPIVTSPSSANVLSPTQTGGTVLPSLLRSGSGDGADRSDTPKAFGDFRRLVSFATRRD